jgi:HAE1 family hydrophobic/amphiphilic exporter-1
MTLDLFLISFLTLFLELTCIRWFPSHVLFLTFFTNTVLLASILGIAVGCLAAKRKSNLIVWTPVILAIALASVFIYIVLAMQFESFVQPLVIMTALPLSVAFALLTLAMTGRPLNLWSTLGILLLLGIVKKNSILQVDYTNVLIRRGVPLETALVEASRTRLRPILMTTAAIVAGLIPTALGVGSGARQRGDIAMTIIGGQTLCLFLTLLLVPVSYSLAEEGIVRAKTFWRARRAGTAETSA